MAGASCPDATITITTQTDADKLGQCQTFDGDIVLTPTIKEDITLRGIQKINGALYTGPGTDTADKPTNAQFTLSSNTLTSISGNLTLSSMPGLYGLFLPNLTTVGGPVTMSELPVLANLSLQSINSVGNIRIISAPKLVNATMGSKTVTTDPTIGLKHITDPTDATIEVRNVGLSNVDGLIDLYNASNLILKDLPNLNSVILRTGNIDQVEIQGNNDLTVYTWEGSIFTDTPQPIIGTLNISGVKQVDPCLWPDVHNFIAVNNSIEYLHFGFKSLQRIEVRDNPNLRRFLPWNGPDFATINVWLWNLTDLIIKDNPLLTLQHSFPRAANDTLTAQQCPFMFREQKDDWYWWPFHMQSLVIDANIDNTYL
ncbi:hypothetical protein BGW36DRAFT_433170 [Talaromyces proteolyticus]|uniref:Receptor L-domain domain-containing protein n=1 Tax=Talaromyces proteolyticus TaxID=1131652 RepID=A0AAD4PT55_9EURO|nr:uncharacterized protein BGW36DRAFT_433170 [Talaromyces proteolyticus]KAH8690219.1 hypothetical protein BGW36DRAFT_433170 [Talaromyces proteolyticus]